LPLHTHPYRHVSTMIHAATQRQQKHLVFCFNDTAPTEIYTLSLHDALPISHTHTHTHTHTHPYTCRYLRVHTHTRSEEHTSELQSHLNLVCRLLLENTH